MRIALCYNLNRGASDQEAEFDLPLTIDALHETLEEKHTVQRVECLRDCSWIADLQSFSPDLIFNVAEGYAGSAREAFYPTLFEQLGIPYSGPSPSDMFLCQNKHVTKFLLHDWIPVPGGVVLEPGTDSTFQGPYPAIIKLNSEGSSIGIGPESIVYSETALLSRLQELGTYGKEMVVEEFLGGRDLSMSYIEGLGILGPVEYIYPQGTTYDFNLKTAENHLIDVVVPHDIDDTTVLRLKELTQKAVSILGLKGYARIDFRMTPGFIPYLLEINAQVCFHPQGAFVLAAARDGFSFRDVVLHCAEYPMAHPRRCSNPLATFPIISLGTLYERSWKK